MADTLIVPYSLDDYFQSTPIGSIDKAIGNNLYGFNHRQVAGAVPANRDLYGYTFFTRPQLNLQTDNIRNFRQLSGLLNGLPLSVQTYVRCMLDPRLMAGYSFGKTRIPRRQCPLVDNSCAFMPILTNNINSISGWPDMTSPIYTSPPGLYNEAHSMVDGIVKNFEAYNVDASFRNTRGDPILYKFYVWLHYMSAVFEGRLVPYLDFITENEIEYNTRIFRVSVDKQRNKVTKIFSTIAIPISCPTSSFADFNKDTPYNDQNKDITIRFQCNGFETFDDILIAEFNDIVQIFSPEMRDENRDRYMVLLDPNIATMFNNRGLPRINPTDSSMEWWVPRATFDNRTQAFLRANFLNKEEAARAQDEQFTGD